MADDPRQVGDRIEQLLGQVRGMVTPPAWERVDDLVRNILSLYGGALERVLAILDEPELQERLCADPLLTSLFVLHGCHPVDPMTRVERAAEKAGVEVIRVDDDGLVHLAADGDPVAQAAAKRIIMEAAPEVTGVEIDPKPKLVQIGKRPLSEHEAGH